MTLEEEQKVLLKIVETWRLSEKPEYRGFRCANCQQYKNEAWYHWVNTGGYKLPIHMCNDTCEPAFQNNSIQIDERKRQVVNREMFGRSYIYSPEATKRFREIINTWPTNKKPELKAFTCDQCDKELDIDNNDGLRKGYHVWWKMDDGKTLAELHFHKECATLLGITE
ncbi:hypothetical protein HYS93_00740 [Candidatus Daviesbacteria bacterium]|nr:hypothetical protein [Candidatus Daviesbacteria bacterium]